MKKYMIYLSIACSMLLPLVEAVHANELGKDLPTNQSTKQKKVTARLIFRTNDTWDWIGQPIEIPNVEAGTAISIEKYAPADYTFQKEELKNYIVTDYDFNFLEDDGETWILNVPMVKKKLALRSDFEKGLMLDVARDSYAVPVIKKYIQQLSAKPNSYLHLHLSDNENFAVESDLLGQSAKEATQKEGLYVNNKTGKTFLSKAQLQEIVDYAMEKNVTIIPEIDTPSHLQTALELLKEKEPALYNQISLKNNPHAWNTIDFSKAEAIEFVLSLQAEYLPIFAKQKRRIFHIGGDEFYDLPQESNTDFVHFVNTINRHLNAKGFQTRVWNDGFMQKDLEHFDKNLQITYWSLTGFSDKENTTEKATLSKKYNADAKKLVTSGFELLNYNAYYLYLIARAQSFREEAMGYSIRDMQVNWDVNQLELNTGERLADLENVRGAAISIWGEPTEHYSGEEIFHHSSPMLSAYLGVGVTTSETFRTLSFHLNGGEGSSFNQLVEIGKKAQSVPSPTRKGYAFSGWFTTEGKAWDFHATTMPSTDVALYAKWEQIPTPSPAVVAKKPEDFTIQHTQPKSLRKKGKHSLKATTTGSNTKISYKVISGSDKGSVDAKGNVVAKSKKGTFTVRITASKAGGPTKTKDVKFTVTDSVTKLTVASKKTLLRKKTAKLNAKADGAKVKFTYKSSNKKTVKVDSKGKITALKKGKATITVTATSSDGAKVRKTVTIVVK